MGVSRFGRYLFWTTMLVAACLSHNTSSAGIVGLTRVATGLSQPVFATHAPGDRNRLFIVERGSPNESADATALIRILDLQTGELNSTPFLTIPGLNNFSEGGLLGMAFHPDYASNGKFYVNVTANDTNPDTPYSTFIREYTVSADLNIANPTFAPVLSFVQPQTNHNGGWIGFSPVDKYLYIMAGDGGAGLDQGPGHTEPGGNAQDITDNLLGKVLRINVDADDYPSDVNRNYAIPFDQPDRPGNPFAPNEPGGEDSEGDNEIFAYGLRNPFRASFDRAAGDLWIGDVGQNQREEVDLLRAGSPGGENYGWRLREGDAETNGVGGPEPADYVAPAYDYKQEDGLFGGSIVTGGYVYRGPDPTLQGLYIFGDTRASFDPSIHNFWSFDPADPYGTVANLNTQLIHDVGVPGYFASFGEDAVGNLYVVYWGTSDVYRIVTDSLQPGDFDADADVDASDLELWQSGFGTLEGAGASNGDADGDGAVDGDDFVAWQQNLGWSALNASSVLVSPTMVPEPAGAAIAAIALAGLALASRGRKAACTRGSETGFGAALSSQSTTNRARQAH